MRTSTLTAVACGACAITLGLSGCGASFEGSGSKDAASAEQLAMRTDDPWAAEIVADPAARAESDLHDGVYTGEGRGMEGPITVTLLVDDGRISCLGMTQEGESQSRGGFEAIRDGKFAAMIEAAQGADIDAIAGATITTAGVKQAVEDALAQAEAGAASDAARASGAESAAAVGGASDAAAADDAAEAAAAGSADDGNTSGAASAAAEKEA